MFQVWAIVGKTNSDVTVRRRTLASREFFVRPACTRLEDVAAKIHDEKFLGEAAREMLAAFRAQRFQHVVALFDQLLQRQAGLGSKELLEQLVVVGGDNFRGLVGKSYAYDSCWFCDLGMARCDHCDATGQMEEGLFCIECHGLGKLRCTVCRGSSFVLLEEIPEFFREQVVEERLTLAERAHADVARRVDELKSEAGGAASKFRKRHHQSQQVMGVLHNCHPFVARNPNSKQAARFNAIVRGAQEQFHRLSENCARSSLAAARRLVEGNHAQDARLGTGTRMARSIEHSLEVARGYIEILNRAGLRGPGESMAFDIREIEQKMSSGDEIRMVVPVGSALEEKAPSVPLVPSVPLAPTAPRPRRHEPPSRTVTEFVEELSDFQVEEVFLLFREEWWSQKRTLEQTRRMVAGSSVNLAMMRPDGMDKRVIGYVRAVTDGVLKAVIYDFVVAKQHRGSGLGKLLIKRLLSHEKLLGVEEIELYCVPEMIEMFKQWAFSENVDGTVHLRYVRP